MKRREWEYLGFGFGSAVVLGLAAWGAIALTKKVVQVYKEKTLSDCCCDDDDCCCDDDDCCCDEDGCCCDDDDCCCDDDDCCCDDEKIDSEKKTDSLKSSTDTSDKDSEEIIKKSVNAQDDVVSPEF